MAFSVEIIRRDEQSTSAWPGGTTTQLAIHPKTSDYKSRNFKWRLSSARVDAEESTFTSLPGIWRHIMVIEGEMKLVHEGHHSILLKSFEQDSFSGGWATRSIGRARDFNLMLGQVCKGGLEAMFIPKGDYIEAAANTPETGFMNYADAFYCAAGSVEAAVNGEGPYTLYEGDLMIIYMQGCEGTVCIGFECTGRNDAAIIRARILY